MNNNYVLYDFDNNMGKLLTKDASFMMDRTGVGCFYLPGVMSVIDISERIPVPTRRKTAWKSMLKEYLWFISGSHNINDLNKMGSKVWDFWRDDKFTQDNGFEEGSIGYGYGYNLIHYGADIHTDETGFNQLDFVINELKTNPSSRRILFSFYRPDKSDSKSVKLPPCHIMYQFVVEPDQAGHMNKLSCCVYQRSSDSFIGNLSTNLQGASFLTYMIAQQVNMTPNKLYHFSGHFHLYSNHVEQLKEYLGREAPNSPILKLNKKNSIYEYTADDFELEDYNPLAKIDLEVAV